MNKAIFTDPHGYTDFLAPICTRHGFRVTSRPLAKLSRRHVRHCMLLVVHMLKCDDPTIARLRELKRCMPQHSAIYVIAEDYKTERAVREWCEYIGLQYVCERTKYLCKRFTEFTADFLERAASKARQAVANAEWRERYIDSRRPKIVSMPFRLRLRSWLSRAPILRSFL